MKKSGEGLETLSPYDLRPFISFCHIRPLVLDQSYVLCAQANAHSLPCSAPICPCLSIQSYSQIARLYINDICAVAVGHGRR